jgi:regulator of sirC expression with transglutaminase-like and TPR domain
VVILQEFPGSVERRSQRERFGQAKYDFERYLELAPDADDAAAIREQLVEIAEQVVLIH